MLTFSQLKQWAYQNLDNAYTLFADSPGAARFCNMQDAMLVYQTVHRCELPAERMDLLLVQLSGVASASWSSIVVREILKCTLGEALGRPARTEA